MTVLLETILVPWWFSVEKWQNVSVTVEKLSNFATAYTSTWYVIFEVPIELSFYRQFSIQKFRFSDPMGNDFWINDLIPIDVPIYFDSLSRDEEDQTSEISSTQSRVKWDWKSHVTCTQRCTSKISISLGFRFFYMLHQRIPWYSSCQKLGSFWLMIKVQMEMNTSKHPSSIISPTK